MSRRISATDGAADTGHLPADTAVYLLMDADNGMFLDEDPLLMELQILDIYHLTLRSICIWMQITV